MHIFRTEGIGDSGFIPRKHIIKYPTSGRDQRGDDPWADEIRASSRGFSGVLNDGIKKVSLEFDEMFIKQLSALPTRKLQKMLKEKSLATRIITIRALSLIREDSKAIELVLERLVDEDEHCLVRAEAACALGDLGAKEAIPVLILSLIDKKEVNERTTVEQTLPTLLVEVWDVGVSAAEALGKLKAKEAIPVLIERLNDKDEHPSMKLVAIDALGDIRAKDAIPALIERLNDEDEDVRGAAKEALEKIREKNKE